MNREIKFRAWDKSANRMMYAFFVGSVFGDIFGTHNIISDSRTEIDKMSSDKYELMQFTGLKDKNGKEMYEGDIILYKSAPHQRGEIRIIKWSNYNCSFGFTEKSCKNSSIIGNIYENPELIKGNK